MSRILTNGRVQLSLIGDLDMLFSSVLFATLIWNMPVVNKEYKLNRRPVLANKPIYIFSHTTSTCLF